ncbi:hypothetical protein [Demequina sp. NBRC 110056]|uniref:arsenate reductase/protein-tyrosine-phosphatase family protein n=1 Tax=Demequina sp. NBRC 110056 TaxID=1570345 RepID=UPI000A0395A7|nr:hypothetical protein [Demequina sp. NBRC 110056]
MGVETADTFRVLIVDLEGIGRAPAGERFLRHELEARGIGPDVISVRSAGLTAQDGGPLHPRTVKAIEDRGADASGYTQRQLNRDWVDEADMIICGNGADRDEVAARFPAAAKKTFSLSEIFYLYEMVVAIAPLREHPALLMSRVAGADLTDDFDLPPMSHDPVELEARIEALADQIQRAAFWVATIWQSMLPEDPSSRPAMQPGDHQVDLVAFGVTVRVVCTGDAPYTLATLVDRTWLWLKAPAPHEGEPDVTISIAVYADEDARLQARADGWMTYETLSQAMHFLSSTVTVRAIDRRAGQLVMLHAAGLATPDGKVVGFVAPSGTGKTTISRTLGKHFGYVTDETLAIEFDGTVLRYPKPLSVITDRDARLKEQMPAHDLDLMRAPSSLSLARVVILNRDPDAGDEPVVEQMPLLHGLAVIAEQTSYITHLPAKLHTLADTVESVGGVWRVTYREAAHLVALVPALADGTVDLAEAEVPAAVGGVA